MITYFQQYNADFLQKNMPQSSALAIEQVVVIFGYTQASSNSPRWGRGIAEYTSPIVMSLERLGHLKRLPTYWLKALSEAPHEQVVRMSMLST
ncbi:MAG: hypothetical protein HQL32_02470 [Planctomycetes bacterium]|nr:hypothetical protein [Planctomycetota bacterium]